LKESVGRSDPRLIGLGAEEAAAAARSRREELETGWTAEEAFKWAEREATSIAAARREKAEEKKRERVFAKERSARRAMVDMWVKDAAGAKDAPLRPSPSGRADLDLSKALADLPGSGDIGRLRASEISAAMGTPAGMERYLAACAAVFDGHAEDPSGPTFDAAARGAENPRLMLVLSAALYGAPPDRVWGCSEIKEGSRWAERLRDIRAALEGLPPAPLSDKSVGKEHLRSATKLAAGFARIRRPETVSLHPLSAFVLAEKSLDGNLLSCALSMLGPESIRALSSALDGVGKGAVRPAPSKGGSVLD